MGKLSKFGGWQIFLAHQSPEALFKICGIGGKYTAAIRQKTLSHHPELGKRTVFESIDK